MTVDLDAIRARLAAATPGPWAAGVDIDPADGYWSTENVHAVDALPVAILRRDEDHSDEQIAEFDTAHDRGVIAETHNHFPIPDEQHDANQRLIANAPADLAALINLVLEQRLVIALARKALHDPDETERVRISEFCRSTLEDR